MNPPNLKPISTWKLPESKEAVLQVVEILEKTLGLQFEIQNDGTAFSAENSKEPPLQGIHQVNGEIINDAYISIKMELARVGETFRGSWQKIFDGLANIGTKVSIIAPPRKIKYKSTLWVELKTGIKPMSPARMAPFSKQLKIISNIAKSLQEEIPVIADDRHITQRFEKLKEVVKPVYPDRGLHIPSSYLEIAKKIYGYLTASCCVAITSKHPVASEMFLSYLAAALMDFSDGKTLGVLTRSNVKPENLLEQVQKLPCILVVSAEQLNFGTTAYEMNNEIRALLSSLSAMNKPCVFTGTHSKLQNVFSGGQLAEYDPLSPVVMHLPRDVHKDLLINFSIDKAAREGGGLPEKVREDLAGTIWSSIENLPGEKHSYIIPYVANSGVNLLNEKGKDGLKDLDLIVANMCNQTETLSGLGKKMCGKRQPHIQKGFIEALVGSDILSYLKSGLYGQDKGLEKLVNRFAVDAVTRPSYQPVRACVVGTPATGKSDAARLIAEYMNIPYEIIDASAFSNFQMANTQLFGSGPGYVDSYKIPRLMKIASHYQGCVLEISDLDHAASDVRSLLAESFLQILQTGFAQSGFGTTFSCASIIFIFTLNLPDGADEKLSRKLGFGGKPAANELTHTVEMELKKFLSGAFLSRIGEPIVFEHLRECSLAMIIENKIIGGIRNACENLCVDVADVRLDSGLGERLLYLTRGSSAAFGARRIEDFGWNLAGNAMIDLKQKGKFRPLGGKHNLFVRLSAKEMRLVLEPY
jgi:hypothetical protein